MISSRNKHLKTHCNAYRAIPLLCNRKDNMTSHKQVKRSALFENREALNLSELHPIN